MGKRSVRRARSAGSAAAFTPQTVLRPQGMPGPREPGSDAALGWLCGQGSDVPRGRQGCAWGSSEPAGAHRIPLSLSWVVGSWLEAGNMGIPQELGQMERGCASRHRQTPAPGEPHGTLLHTSEHTPGVATRAEKEGD